MNKCIRCKKLYEEAEAQGKTIYPYIELQIVGLGFANHKAGLCPNCQQALNDWLIGDGTHEWQSAPLQTQKWVWKTTEQKRKEEEYHRFINKQIMDGFERSKQ